jgi:hypothetical protein
MQQDAAHRGCTDPRNARCAGDPNASTFVLCDTIRATDT